MIIVFTSLTEAEDILPDPIIRTRLQSKYHSGQGNARRLGATTGLKLDWPSESLCPLEEMEYRCPSAGDAYVDGPVGLPGQCLQGHSTSVGSTLGRITAGVGAESRCVKSRN